MSQRNVLILAGETSGDMHAAKLVRELKILRPEWKFYGMGGDELAAQGVEILVHIRDMSIMGFVEVIRHLPKISKVMNLFLLEIDKRKTDLIIPVDYPGFNLKLIEKVKDGRFHPAPKIFYYISPQVWAWGAGRIPKIARLVERMAGILPFETETYAGTGLDFHFVGHPLLDNIPVLPNRAEFCKKHDIPVGKKLIALLPGSRAQEVSRILPPMLEAARIMQNKIPCTAAIGAAGSVEPSLFGNTGEVKIIRGETKALMKNADVVITASGTATLETAVAGTPMVVVYKMNALTYSIGKRVVKIKNIALVNVTAGKTIVPELIQSAASGKNIAAEALKILEDPERDAWIRRELNTVRQKLGQPGASSRAAQLICDM